MIVLGLDTATSATSVALRLADGSSLERRDDPPAGSRPGHATQLLGLTNELLSEAGIGWTAIERIAAGAGPGTFTGLRVGLATAHGLAQSLETELVRVSSLQAIAYAAAAAGRPAPHLAVIDARRKEVFAALYGTEGEELLEPVPLAPETLAGSVPASVEAFGDGALRYREVLERTGLAVGPEDSSLHLVSAIAICELGSRAALGSAAAVLPDYRRRPDAELARVGEGTS